MESGGVLGDVEEQSVERGWLKRRLWCQKSMGGRLICSDKGDFPVVAAGHCYGGPSAHGIRCHKRRAARVIADQHG